MRRRGFLKRLAGVATAAVVSERVIPDDGVSLFSAKHPTLLHDAAHHDLTGFGLASAKAEGATIPYDLTEESLEHVCIEVKKRGGILARSDFAKQLADGLNKCFAEAYEDYEPDEWPKPGG